MARKQVDQRDARVPVGSGDGGLQLPAHERMSIQNKCINILASPPCGGYLASPPGGGYLASPPCGEAGTRLRGPGGTRGTGGLDAKEHGVGVAVEPGFDHLHAVAGGGSLLPQAAGARMEPGLAGLPRLGPGLLVHVSEHQHLAGGSVLDHSRHQALGEVGFHRLISSPRAASSSFTAAIESSRKWKIVAASAASAPPVVSASYMWAAVPAPPDAITGRRTAELTAPRRARS